MRVRGVTTTLVGLLWVALASRVVAQDGQDHDAAGEPTTEDLEAASAEPAMSEEDARRVLPMRFAQRPLTLPNGVVRIDATFGIVSRDVESVERETLVTLLGVAAFGITDDIELGVSALPLQLAPRGRYGDPGVYGLLRLYASERLDVGLQLDATVPVRDESAFGNALSTWLLWRALAAFRLDVGVALVAAYHDPIRTHLRVPVVGTFQLSDGLFAGVRTGLDVEHLSGADEEDGRPRDVVVPVGAFVGGTLDGEAGPIGDLRIGVLLPSVADGLASWQLGFGGSFYIY